MYVSFVDRRRAKGGGGAWSAWSVGHKITDRSNLVYSIDSDLFLFFVK